MAGMAGQAASSSSSTFPTGTCFFPEQPALGRAGAGGRRPALLPSSSSSSSASANSSRVPNVQSDAGEKGTGPAPSAPCRHRHEVRDLLRQQWQAKREADLLRDDQALGLGQSLQNER